MKKRILLVCACLAAATLFTGCGSSSAGENGELNVYNWGEYIDEDVISMFEEETGIKVNYKTYDTNEDMYPIIANGAADWDVVCPSEYMIQKMLDNDLLLEIDYDNVPNISYIADEYMETVKEFDPDATHSVPYMWGTVGILYNETMVDEPITSWSALWDEKYADNIVMMNNPRDVFAPALISCGYSLNSTDDNELNEAAAVLRAQKPYVLKYTTDEVRDMMIGEKAAIGVIYSGEATICKDENENLQYVVPEEGSNVWLDCWVIPKTCKNKENAEKWIDFLCRPDIALMNFEYIGYSTPNTGVLDLIEDEDVLNNEALFPGDDVLARCETFQYLGEDAEEKYNNLWKQVLSE
jgi:spermidine/putrescine-binding protein